MKNIVFKVFLILILGFLIFFGIKIVLNENSEEEQFIETEELEETEFEAVFFNQGASDEESIYLEIYSDNTFVLDSYKCENVVNGTYTIEENGKLFLNFDSEDLESEEKSELNLNAEGTALYKGPTVECGLVDELIFYYLVDEEAVN